MEVNDSWGRIEDDLEPFLYDLPAKQTFLASVKLLKRPGNLEGGSFEARVACGYFPSISSRGRRGLGREVRRVVEARWESEVSSLKY